MGNIKFLPNTTLRFVIIIMGFTATALQILIIRELLIIFHGNELFIGIIFAFWLIFQAVGSYFLRKKAEFTKNYIKWFSLIQLTTGIFCPLALLLIRSFRYFLNISTGEVLGIYYVVLLCFIALLPVTLMGALFPLACKNFRDISQEKASPVKVYLYESLGSFVAGIVFVFYFIYHLSSIEIALIILSLNLCSVTFYLTFIKTARILRNLSFIFLILIIISFFTFIPERIHKLSSNLLWYEHSLVDTRNSPYSNIAVIKQQEQYTVFVNGAPYAVTPTPEILTEEFAYFPMLFHEKPEHILVIGAGLGGILEEILKYPVKKIDYAEPDPMLIESFKKILANYVPHDIIQEKINIHFLEGRIFLKKTKYIYDLILINLPLPTTLQMNRYYTMEFFKLVKEKLKDNGILAIKLPGSEIFISEELKNLNSSIYKTLNDVFPYVRVITGDQNIFIASLDISIKTLGEEALIERLYLKNISSNIINEWYLRYKMNNAKFRELEKEIIISTQSRTINHDIHPRAVFESMLFFNSAISPYMVKILQFLEKIECFYYFIFISIIFIIFLIIQTRRKNIFLTFVIASTGFMSMLISILLIILFQIYYGYVYHYIGILTSLFMIGSALGAYKGLKMPKTSLVKVELSILFLIVFLYLTVTSVPDTGIKQLMLFIAITITGFFSGIEFPLAVNLSDSYKTASITPGRFYALDLLGAFLGAVLPAIVFIPILGIKNTLLITLTIKLASFILTCIHFFGQKMK